MKQTIIFSILFSVIFSQEKPAEFFNSKIDELLFEVGANWNVNTTFRPIRYQNYKSNEDSKFSDSLSIKFTPGFLNKNDNISLYFYEHITFKKNFYSYLYARIVDEPSEFPRYSGKPQDNSRFGFTSGEVDLSGVGYQNDWLLLQIGRGRQSWGAGSDIQLALSNKSAAYDYSLLGMNFDKIRFRYMHGFLDSDSVGFNRYIVSKGLEYSNFKSLIFSLSEIVIYSGLNRPMDFSYLNPLSSHLEIELNDRQNLSGTKSANAIWQFSLDWMINKNMRFSGNFVLDELVIDQIEKDLGKDHRTANSLRISYRLFNQNKFYLIGYISSIKVGTLTFRHGDGKNNFTNRGMPLGWEHGSDSFENKIGLKFFNKQYFIFTAEFGARSSGENNILQHPYETYTEYQFSEFPSGNINDTKFINSSLIWKVNSYLDIRSSFNYSQYDSKIKDTSLIFGINYSFPFKVL